MPSEVMRDITLRRVTPASGEEALGKWRAPYRNHCLDSEPGSSGNLNGCRAGGITMPPRGVCRRVLEPRAAWEGPLGKWIYRGENPRAGGDRRVRRSEKSR